jgi:hypothetical protein
MIGIYLMGFVILTAGVGVLGMAIAYVLRPTEAKLALIRPLSVAGIFAALCSFSVGMASALQGVSHTPDNPENLPVMLSGISESFIPLFVAFAFLAVAWLLVAAGMRRQV